MRRLPDMWSFMVIAALIFSLVIALFALANQQPVTVNYFLGQTEISAVLLILGSAIGGALVMAMLGVVGRIKIILRLRELRFQYREQQLQLEALQEENRELQDRLQQPVENEKQAGEAGTEEEKIKGQAMEKPEAEEQRGHDKEA